MSMSSGATSSALHDGTYRLGRPIPPIERIRQSGSRQSQVDISSYHCKGLRISQSNVFRSHPDHPSCYVERVITTSQHTSKPIKRCIRVATSNRFLVPIKVQREPPLECERRSTRTWSAEMVSDVEPAQRRTDHRRYKMFRTIVMISRSVILKMCFPQISPQRFPRHRFIFVRDRQRHFQG